MRCGSREGVSCSTAWGPVPLSRCRGPRGPGRERRTGRQAHEVRSAGAAPGRRASSSRPRADPTGTRSPRPRSRGSCIPTCRRRRCGPTTTAPGSRVRRARSGWRSWLETGTPLDGELHPRPSRDLPGLAPGRHAADAARQRGALDDPPARRVRRGRQRRQPGGDARRVRSGPDADRLLHQPVAPDAGVAPLVPRPRPRHDAAQRLRRARRRLHPAGRVRHRRRSPTRSGSPAAPTRSRS